MVTRVPVVYYKEAMEQCHSFNSRLMAERRVRLPYLDSQTGVAQNNCNLMFERWQRSPGLEDGQVYSYPNKRWKKRARTSGTTATLLETPFCPPGGNKATGNIAPVAENHPHVLFNENSNSSSSQPVEYDVIGDFHDSASVEYFDEDDDYFDDDSRKRKTGRRARGRVRGLRRLDKDDEKDKPYQCSFCGKRYKNKPGLNHHVQRSHQDEDDIDEDYNPRISASASGILDQDSNTGISSKTGAASTSGSVAGSNTGEDFDEDERPSRSRRKKQTVSSAYCDFCLGDADENKKTGGPEELVSCADCGRSGHPTCLQFTDIMTMNVKKYKWQCIECKSCHLCGTSDNDDQLLFCDDCDRGYHMYCLTPPMSEPPEGSWICSLCEADKKEREAAK